MEGVLDAVGDAGFLAATIGANLFILLYSILARFWRSVDGWHIFSFMGVIALILNHASLLIVIGRYPGADVVRAVLYPALGLVIFWRVIILLRVQIEKRAQLLLPTVDADEQVQTTRRA